jgi:glycosyltransferase involved in cell wall biosynthesis
MPRVDIVIPVYNEERALPAAIAELRTRLDGWKYEPRLVIADNASIDRTEEIGRELGQAAGTDYVRIAEKGRGRALKQVWLDSDADAVSYMDVDLSTGLEALTPLIDAVLEEGYQVATGSRTMAGSRITRSSGRRTLTWFYNRIIRLVMGVHFSDAQCGFKALSHAAAQELMPLVQDNNWFFDTELLVLAEKSGYRIKDVPVTWVEDKDSRVNVPATVLEDLAGLLRMRRTRPWRQLTSGES